MAVTLQNPRIRTITDGSDASEDGDRLSNLPEPIIHYIFSSLETIDVIRASAVSRKWRYFWVSIPYLNFNIHRVWSNPEEKWYIDKIVEKFKDFVNWVLLFQNGSIDIQTFRLSCFNDADDNTLFRWFSVLVRRNVQELDLNIVPYAPLQFPNSLMTCESLVTLKLDFHHHCALILSSSAGFSRLKSLHLLRVEFSDHILLQNFISSCPLLENLNMESCIFCEFKFLDISSTSLKHLVLHNSYFGESDPVDVGLRNCEKLKIACPNLLSFRFLGPLAHDFSFEELKYLENVFIYVDCLCSLMAEHCGYRLHKLLKGICNTKDLKLSLSCVKFLHARAKPVCFSTSFYNLKSLKLAMYSDDFQMQSVINLLSCSPNLEALTICFDGSQDDCWEIPDEAIMCLTYHLQMVELLDFQGNANEMELLRFLLKNGHVLQKISIKRMNYLENDTEIIEEIMELPRSSPNVALKFLETTDDAIVDFIDGM